MSFRGNPLSAYNGPFFDPTTQAEAEALRHPAVVAAFWPRFDGNATRIASGRFETVDLIDPNRVWRPIPAASGTQSVAKGFHRTAAVYTVADGAVADMKLYNRELPIASTEEFMMGIDPRKSGGFAMIQAIRANEDAFARAASFADGSRDVYHGPRGSSFVNNRWYAWGESISSTTGGDFLLHGTYPEIGQMRVFAVIVDFDAETIRLLANTATIDHATRAVSKSISRANNLPAMIEYLRVGHRNSGRIDDCQLGPCIFVNAPLDRAEHRALLTSLMLAVTSAVGVPLG